MILAIGRVKVKRDWQPIDRLPKLPLQWGLLSLASIARGTSLEFLIFRALVFLFPVAAYCLYLAMLNSREHPTMLSGPWDFLGVLLGTSGFLLVGGPTILSAFYGGWRNQTALGIAPIKGGPEAWYFWVIVWLCYLTAIVVGAIIMLRKRRNVTVIYNIEPAMLDQLLVRIIEQYQLACRRIGNRLFITPAVHKTVAVPSALGQYGITAERTGPSVPTNGEPLPGPPDERRASLELEPFLSMCNVTLRWQGDASLRHDLEAELERELRSAPAPENASAGWFMTAASSIFGVLFLALVVFIVWRLRRGP